MAVNADKLVEIVPRVISAGTSGLNFSGLFLSKSDLLPTNRVVRFSSADAVGSYFGTASDEYNVAATYFAGYTNTQYLPDYIYFAAYSSEPVSAWLRGAELDTTLASLKQVTDGNIAVNVDGATVSATGIDLSGATSLSEIAQLIENALLPADAVPATAGTLTGAEITADLADYEGQTARIAITIDGQIFDMPVTVGTNSDVSDLNAVLSQVGASAVLDGTRIVITSGTTGASSSVGYAYDVEDDATTLKNLSTLLGLTEAAGATAVAGTDGTSGNVTVSYSSQTGAFQFTSQATGENSSIDYATAASETGTDLSALLNLTSALGATLSEGTEGSTLTDAMTNVLKYARDWVSFSTIWEADYDEKIELAKWCNDRDVRFLYVMWDTDTAVKTQNGETTAGYAINNTLSYSGTCCVYDTLALAAGVMGAVACLNFDQYNGRTTLAYRQWDGVEITCDDDEEFENIIANGYNCYGDFAAAAANYNFFQKGTVSGEFMWLDTYCNAIAIKDRLQLNILDLFAASRSIPYNEEGYAQIRTACLDTIETFVNFGAIRSGVTLSNTQKVQLLQEIGQDITNTLNSQGWYMQISDPGATARQNRETPTCLFYYCDGGSIQKIEMSSSVIL